MRPWLFTIGGYTLHAYPAFLTLAFVAAALLGLYDATRWRRLHVSPWAPLYVIAGGLIGAHGAALLAAGQYTDLWRAVFFWESGLAGYGGVLGGALVGWVYARRQRLPILPLADAAAPALALLEGIIRIGCFLNGCCFGAVCAWPIAVTFPKHSLAYQHQVEDGLIAADAAQSLPVYPSQLVMAAAMIAAVPLLRHLLKRPAANGITICAYLIVQGIARFTMDAMRAGTPPLFAGLTAMQWIAPVLVIAGVAGVIVANFLRGNGAHGQRDHL